MSIQPGNNGIEVSLDGTELYVVSSGHNTISVFSNTNPARLLRTTPRMDSSPDNVHMTPGGLLLTGGPSWVDHNCVTGEDFDLEEFASCPRGTVGATFSALSPALVLGLSIAGIKAASKRVLSTC